MAKALKVIGIIAGAVAIVATAGVALFGAAAVGSALGISAGAAASIGAIAGVVSGVANIGAGLLTKPPPARGSVTQLLISPDAPAPYVMGRGLFAGVLRHDVAYGATLKKVPNPYRWMVTVLSVGGPVAALTPYVDLAPVSSWYSGFMASPQQLGLTPEGAALAPVWSGAPGWSSASKLSGKAAIGWNLKFDKDAQRFASGLPRLAGYGDWVKVYDPRKDSTFPGGSGAHRLGVESTYEWSQNAALHAGMYAFGRFANGKQVAGVGMPAAAIDFVTVAAWANVFDANGWGMFGVTFEPANAEPQQAAQLRMQNLRDICVAGAGEPAFSGGVLSFRYSAPKVALDTFTDADLAGEDGELTAQASYRDRINTIVPKYRSEAHDWELVDAAPVVVSALVTEDGETRQAEWPFNFVTDANQAASLARYRIEDSRELQPISLTYKQRCRAYRPGECVHLDHPGLGLDIDAIILRREFDAASLTTTFTFMSETPGKHAFALGQTGTAPPTPYIGQTGQERDELAAAAIVTVLSGYDRGLIQRSNTNPPFGLLTAHDAGSDATVTIIAHDRVYDDRTVSISGGTVTGLSYDTDYSVYYDDAVRVGGAVTLEATTDAASSGVSDANQARHSIGAIHTPAAGAADTTGGGVYDLSAIIANINWSTFGLF